MGYIENLRKNFGHDLLMTVGCGVLIENDGGQVLLQKRSDTGEWCIPGGALEPMETYKQAAARELREETGIDVTDLKLFGLYSGEDRRIKYPNQDVVYSLSVIFITKSYTGKISDEDYEVLEHRFFSREDIPVDNLFRPDSRPILDWKNGNMDVTVD